MSPVDEHTPASGLPERKKKNGSNEQSTDNNKHTKINEYIMGCGEQGKANNNKVLYRHL